ncbi:MAG: glycosyltransferase family 2 protein [Nitrospirota bacterium]
MISVVIPNYNRADLLGACLASLRAQTYRDFEVIVVDNGSDDGSSEMAAKDFPEVRLIRLEENKGFSAAVNRGIKKSVGELVALLNNDAEADPAWLSELYSASAAHPEAGFFASKILFYDRHDIIDTVCDCFSVAGFGYKKGWGEIDKGQYDHLKYVFGACGGAAAYRRTMLDAVAQGGEYFDEEYFAFGEDLDISFRAQSMGYRCVAVPGARVYHRIRATAGNSSRMAIFLGYRNFMLTVIKNFPARSIVKHLPSLVAFWCLSILADFVKTRRFIVLKAYLAAVRMMPSMSVKRKMIASKRKIGIAQIDAMLDRGWLATWLRLGINTARVRKVLSGQSRRPVMEDKA